MFEPLHSEAFNFTVQPIHNGLTIVLNHLESGKSKMFFLAGNSDEKSVKALTWHMNSLVDEQCASFVGLKRGKRK